MGSSLFKRSGAVYYSPAQVTVYINGYLVDDACRVSYNVLDNWTPLYGYNDRNWRALIEGQTIVEGELDIRYRYEGYLRRVISAINEIDRYVPKSAQGLIALKNGLDARELSDDTLQNNTAEVINALDSAASGTDEVYVQFADFLKQRFWGETTSAGSRDLVTEDILGWSSASRENWLVAKKVINRYRPSTQRSPRSLCIEIVHGQERNATNPEFVRRLEQVQFRGQSYEANIDVPYGERVVTEAYPFIARNVKPIAGGQA